MPKLSFCAIVKDEAETLPACLESVKEVADQLVILDTGSTDSTVSIAQSYGAKVAHFDWCNDFAAARNEALQWVQGDWVLVLDADERLVPEAIPPLHRAIAQPEALAIQLIRQEVGANQSPYSLVSRLFRHHPALKFSRPYHALIDESVAQLRQREPHWQILALPEVSILHEGYRPEVIASQNKAQRARTAMESYLADHPRDAYTCAKLGALYLELGQAAAGLKLLKQGLKANTAEAPVLFELHYHLANALVRDKLTESALKHYRKAIAQPLLPLLKIAAYNNYAGALKALGKLPEARLNYELALQADPTFAQGHYNLGLTLKEMGLLPEAIAAYKQAIQWAPQFTVAYQNLGVVLLQAGDYQNSQAAFQQAVKLHEQDNPAQAQKLRQELSQIGMSFGSHY